MPTSTEWQTTWEELGAPADAALHDALIARYSEPHRKYHTLQHLTECLENVRELRALAEHAAEIEIALWFHDAIYQVRRNDNEAKSAAWAHASMLAGGTPPAAAARVHELVLATRHNAIPSGNDAAILVDVDLWILGAPPERFDEYERQIRAEYGWVPDFLYRRERRKILQQFLARSRIFNTELFFVRFESQARANVARSLARLDA